MRNTLLKLSLLAATFAAVLHGQTCPAGYTLSGGICQQSSSGGSGSIATTTSILKGDNAGAAVAAVAGDFPTLNQNTTGTAANVSGVVLGANGGTGVANTGKTLTLSNNLTIAGTDSTVMTFPSTSATIARTDAANTFTGHQTIEGTATAGATGSGNLVFATSPTLTTPTIGVATATSVNKLTLTAPATSAVLTILNGKTLTANKSLTLDGTDSTTMTFPSTSATIARTDAANTFTGHQTVEGVTSTGSTGTGQFVFDTSPTISGHPVIEGVTSTGATGTGKFVFDASPTITTPTISGTMNTAAISMSAGSSLQVAGATSGSSTISASATGSLIRLGSANATVSLVGLISSAGLGAGGTKFTTSGCSISSTTGGSMAGKFTLGANTCTAVVTINGATGMTAANGWSCWAADRTAPTVLIAQSADSTTTASFNVPAGAGATDVIAFGCLAY